MQTIGERLEEARKRKGISVREAAETTKIRGDYLQKFEANTFEIDLPPLYIRGFLRSYSRYLELDPERIVNDYNSLLAEGKPVRRETREVYGRVDFAEAARSKDPGEPAPATRAVQDQALLLKFGLLGGGAIVLVVIVILLFKVIFSGSSAKSTTAAQQAAQQNAIVQADPAQTLTLTATDATRVKVVQDLDGAVLFNASLARGESKTFKKLGKLLITVESGKNLRMEVNGRNYPVPVDGYGRFALD
jgi:cytoskeletal protein RodZ